MFRGKGGKDFLIIVFPNCLPRKPQPISRDCGAFFYDLDKCRIANASDNRQSPELWDDLTQKFNSFGEHVRPPVGNSCYIGLRPCKVGYEPVPYPSRCPNHDDGDVCRLPLQHPYKARVTCHQNVRALRYEFAGECRKLIQAADRRYAVKDEVLPLDPAKLY